MTKPARSGKIGAVEVGQNLAERDLASPLVEFSQAFFFADADMFTQQAHCSRNVPDCYGCQNLTVVAVDLGKLFRVVPPAADGEDVEQDSGIGHRLEDARVRGGSDEQSVELQVDANEALHPFRIKMRLVRCAQFVAQ